MNETTRIELWLCHKKYYTYCGQQQLENPHQNCPSGLGQTWAVDFFIWLHLNAPLYVKIKCVDYHLTPFILLLLCALQCYIWSFVTLSPQWPFKHSPLYVQSPPPRLALILLFSPFTQFPLSLTVMLLTHHSPRGSLQIPHLLTAMPTSVSYIKGSLLLSEVIKMFRDLWRLSPFFLFFARSLFFLRLNICLLLVPAANGTDCFLQRKPHYAYQWTWRWQGSRPIPQPATRGQWRHIGFTFEWCHPYVKFVHAQQYTCHIWLIFCISVFNSVPFGREKVVIHVFDAFVFYYTGCSVRMFYKNDPCRKLNIE